MRHPSLFALMLIAFFTVIVISLCGTATVFVISARLNQNSADTDFRPPWAGGGPAAAATPQPGAGEPPFGGPSYSGLRGGFDWRVPLSALLAFSAILFAAAAFFSSRVARPLTRLTGAAQQM